MFGLFGKKDRAIQTYKNNINASMDPLLKAVEKVAKDIFRDYHKDIDKETFSLALHTFIFWGFCRNLQRVCKLEDNQIDEVMSKAHMELFVHFAIKNSKTNGVLDLDKLRSHDWKHLMDQFNIYLRQAFSDYYNAFEMSIPLVADGKLRDLPLVYPFLNEVFGPEKSEKIKDSFLTIGFISVFFAELIGEFDKITRNGPV